MIYVDDDYATNEEWDEAVSKYKAIQYDKHTKQIKFANLIIALIGKVGYRNRAKDKVLSRSITKYIERHIPTEVKPSNLQLQSSLHLFQ